MSPFLALFFVTKREVRERERKFAYVINRNKVLQDLINVPFLTELRMFGFFPTSDQSRVIVVVQRICFLVS